MAFLPLDKHILPVFLMVVGKLVYCKHTKVDHYGVGTGFGESSEAYKHFCHLFTLLSLWGIFIPCLTAHRVFLPRLFGVLFIVILFIAIPLLFIITGTLTSLATSTRWRYRATPSFRRRVPRGGLFPPIISSGPLSSQGLLGCSAGGLLLLAGCCAWFAPVGPGVSTGPLALSQMGSLSRTISLTFRVRQMIMWRCLFLADSVKMVSNLARSSSSVGFVPMPSPNGVML